MNVLLYNISEPPNKINKKLGASTTVENVRFLRENTLNVSAPTIVLKMSDELIDCVAYNYCYIPKLGRYYFITNISTENGLCIYECKCDVLKSFADDILASEQLLSRAEQSSLRDVYLRDDMLKFDVRDTYDYAQFPNKVLDTNCVYCILETIGKGGTIA